jgi:putative transposase
VTNNLPIRRYSRLSKFDYRSPGGYHCTLVTQNRKCTLSRIEDGTVNLTPLGELTKRCLLDLPARFEHVTLDFYEIMPNHVHVILFLSGETQTEKILHNPGAKSGSLSSVIQALKSTVSRLAKPLGYQDIFQRGFHEHVIRDEDDLYNVRRYIQDNPLKWDLDRENPDRKG